jgi:hypothetical protein
VSEDVKKNLLDRPPHQRWKENTKGGHSAFWHNRKHFNHKTQQEKITMVFFSTLKEVKS